MKSLLFHPQNARFWTFIHGGWVKLTLRSGQSLRHSCAYDNGEGWSWESCRWTFDGETVTRDYGSGGRDCDGASSQSGSDECPLADLQTVGAFRPTFNSLGILRPAWRQAGPTVVYDQFAQLEGY